MATDGVWRQRVEHSSVYAGCQQKSYNVLTPPGKRYDAIVAQYVYLVGAHQRYVVDGRAEECRRA